MAAKGKRKPKPKMVVNENRLRAIVAMDKLVCYSCALQVSSDSHAQAAHLLDVVSKYKGVVDTLKELPELVPADDEQA